MNVWIDIETVEYIHFYKALGDELKNRGHVMHATALDSKKVKENLIQHNLSAKTIGKEIDIFGLFSEQADLIRFTLLSDYIKNCGVKIAFSLGSKPMLATCTSMEIPIVLFVKDRKEKIEWVHYALDKSYFIVQDSITEQLLIKNNVDIKKIAKVESPAKDFPKNLTVKFIKEVAAKIELFSAFQDVKA